MRIIGNKMYEVCGSCGSIVCLNKRLFGSLHICTTEEERQKYANEIKSKFDMMEKLLNQSK